MERKIKVIKGKPIIINKEARRLARQLHKDEHLIMYGEIESNHKLDEWYYLMASALITELRNDIKELSNRINIFGKHLKKLLKN